MKKIKFFIFNFLRKVNFPKFMITLMCKIKPSLVYLYRGKNINFLFNKYDKDIKINICSNDLSIKTTMNIKNSDIIPLIKKYLKREQVFIDVGANIGAITLIASKIVGLSGKVFSYEPSSEMFKKLSLNIELNKKYSSNIFLRNIGLGDKKDFKELIPDDQAPGTFTVLNSHDVITRSKKEREIVEIDTLDNDYNKLFKSINFIKLDVEGYELQVLLGGQNSLKKFHPILIIENNNMLNIENFLSDFNYDFYNIYPGGIEEKVFNSNFKTKNILAK